MTVTFGPRRREDGGRGNSGVRRRDDANRIKRVVEFDSHSSLNPLPLFCIKRESIAEGKAQHLKLVLL